MTLFGEQVTVVFPCEILEARAGGTAIRAVPIIKFSARTVRVFIPYAGRQFVKFFLCHFCNAFSITIFATPSPTFMLCWDAATLLT